MCSIEMSGSSIMRSTTGTPELIIFVAGLLLYGVLLWSIHRRFLKKVDLIFARHDSDAPSSAEINKRLDALNQDSAHSVFCMDRHANISFRQQKLTLVYGRVGTRSPGGIRGPVWTLRKTVFALVDTNQMDCMKSTPNIFKCAINGYTDSVFWVSLDALLSGYR